MTDDPDNSDAAAQEAKQDDSMVALAVDRPVAVFMMVVAVAVFGFVSFQKLQQTLLPKISYPSLTIRTEYPGSAPAEVEELVTKQIEDFISVIGNLNGFRSISRAGVSDVILEFEWDTDMSFAAQDVREKVDQVRPSLPQDVKKPLLLKYDPTLDPILRLGLFGDQDLTKLRFYADERLKKELESIDGVAAVRVRGGFESEVRVELDESALRQHRITVGQIQTRLQEENVNLASGMLREGDVEYLVRTLNEFRSVDEIRRLVVARRGRQLVRLEEVARIHVAEKEPDVVTRINGVPSVELAIYKEDAANVVDVAHSIKRKLFGPEWRAVVEGDAEARRTVSRGRDTARDGSFDEEIQLVETLPFGMKLEVLSDQSRFIEASVKEVQTSGIYGAIFAVLVLLLFLRNGFSTVIVAVAIPISVIATFGPMMLFDVTLNIMSLGGLALGIGMLVDASIVVLESIDRCRREGDSIRRAAIRGTGEVSSAVLASVLTTVAVFFPIVFVEGVAGEIFKDQSLTVVFSLLASLVVALFFIPMLWARQRERTSRSVGRVRALGDLARKRVTGPWSGVGVIKRHLKAMSGRRKDGGTGSTVSRVLAGMAAPVVFLLAIPQLVLEAVMRVALVVIVAALFVVAVPLAGIYRLVALVLKPGAMLFDVCYRGLAASYRGVLAASLRGSLVVVLGAGALLWLAWIELDEIGLDLIPEMHSGEIIVEMPQPVGTSLESTAAIAAGAEARVRRLDESGELDVTGYSASIGVARDEIAPAGEGPHTAKIRLRLPRSDDMLAAEARAVAILRADLEQMPDVGRLTFTAPKLFTFSNPLEVQVRGDDLSRIEEVGRRIAREMVEIDGIVDVRSTIQEGSPEFVIEYDRVRLAERNLTLAQAAGTLRDKVKGVVPTRYSVQAESRRIDVLVKIPEENIGSLARLRDIDVSGREDMPVRLYEVAKIIQGRGPSEVRHVGGERTVIINATPEGVDLGTAKARIEEVTARLRADDPPAFRGVIVKVSGQSEEAERSSRELLFALVLAMILVYIVMASQFESLVDPLVIMFSSVFAGVGAVFALSWWNISASVVVFIGGIMLAGIVVNNAIVLVDRINRLHRGGMPRRAAIVEAASQRLRPILMTTATTVLGLIPMAISTGEGAEMRVPMAVTVIAGLTSSTVLTLVIIPVVYFIAHEALDWIKPPRPEEEPRA